MRPPDRLNDHGGQHAPPTRWPCPCRLRRLERPLQLVEHLLCLGKVVQAVAERSPGQVRPEHLLRRQLDGAARDTNVDPADQGADGLDSVLVLPPGHEDQLPPPHRHRIRLRVGEGEAEEDLVAGVLVKCEVVHVDHYEGFAGELRTEDEDPEASRVGPMPTHD